MAHQTKFKYSDKIKVIVNPEMQGELINIVPLYLKNGVPEYVYVMHTIKGFYEVREIDIEKIDKYTWED